MTTFACVPVFWTFAALFILGVLMYALGAGREENADTEVKSPPDPALYGTTGPPPWWVIVLMVVGMVGGLLLLSLVNADY